VKWAKASSLADPDFKLIIFGGKGGSGKTTSAAATAPYLSRIYPNKKLLVMSVYPAHSLCDAFGFDIGNRIAKIGQIDNLHNIIYLPLFAQPVRGMEALRKLAQALYGDIGSAASGSDRPVNAANKAKGSW